MSLVEVITSPEGHLYVISEKYDTDLDRYIHTQQSLSMDDRLCILENIARGLAVLHQSGVIHRDLVRIVMTKALKMANLMCDGTETKECVSLMASIGLVRLWNE